MIYEICNKGKPVRIENSLAGVSRYFKGGKGFSDRTLKRMFQEGGEMVKKKGYTITKVYKRNKIKRDILMKRVTSTLSAARKNSSLHQEARTLPLPYSKIVSVRTHLSANALWLVTINRISQLW